MTSRPPRKIFYTIDNLLQATLGGGMIRYLTYAPHFRQRGYEGEFFTAEHDLSEERIQSQRLKVHVVPGIADQPMQSIRETLLQAAFDEAATFERGSCIVTTDSCGLSRTSLQTVRNGHRKGIVTTFNTSMMPGPMPTALVPSLKIRLLGSLYFRNHSLLITQTHAIERFYFRYFWLPRSKVQTIPNGVDCERFKPPSAADKAAARLRLGLPVEGLIMLTVGSIIPRKRTHLILEAWNEVSKQMPGATLVIAGTLGRRSTFGEHASHLDSYTEKVAGLISRLPNPESVVLTGRQIDNVEDYLQAADAFVFASEREGLPNAVLEAMASGLPCIVAPYEGFPEDGEELGRNGVHHLKADPSPSALAHAMTALLSDVSKRQSVGAAARELLVRTQNLPVIIDQWTSAFERLCQPSR